MLQKLNSFSSFQLAFGRSSFFRSGSPPRESSSGGHNSGMVKATSALSFISSAALNSPESLDRSADIIDDEAHSYSHSNVFNSPTAAGYMSHHQSRGAPTSHPATPGAESKMDSIALSAALGVEAVALTHIFPPSACRDGAKGIYPVVFLSSTCIYPSEENYTWRASAADGSIMIVLDMDEWRHTNDVCYISVLGLSIPEAASLAVESNGIYNSVVASRTTAQYDQAVDELRVQLCSWVRQETSDMNEKDRTAYKVTIQLGFLSF